MSEEEKIRLNQLGEKILIEAGLVFDESTRYADCYLSGCWKNSKMVNEADESVYRELVGIDSQLGTDASKQLTCCLISTTRWDLIKV